MSNEENPQEFPPEFPHDFSGDFQGLPHEQGGWQPTPQGGEYDAEATAFFQLPPEGALDAAPLEAPGHGFVPPMITPLTPSTATDPAATGTWAVHQQAGEEPAAVRWPEPAAEAQQARQAQRPDQPQHFQGQSQQSYPQQATGQWTFTEAEPPAAAPPGEATGQWTIPQSDADGVASPAAEFQWGGADGTSGGAGGGPGGGTSPSSTLPGGAPAPWATERPATLPGGAPAPWATTPEAGPTATDEEAEAHIAPGAGPEPDADAEPAAGRVPDAGRVPAQAVTETDEAPLRDEAAPQEQDEAAPQEKAALSSSTGSEGSEEHPPTSYVLRVNGTDRPVTDAWIGESLLYVLRERLGLAGAKDGCSQGECGACNVQVDGRLVASCLVPAATAAGSEVRTVEGLATDGEPSDVQRALAGCGAVQCGFCIPGMAMTVHDLLEGNHAPSELETRQALCGNLCRCSGYRGVLDAVREVVAEREATAAAEASEEARIPHQAPPGAGSVQPHPHDGGMA